MTTPPDRENDAPLRPQDLSWSAPRPDGPLAQALKLAQAERASQPSPFIQTGTGAQGHPGERLEHDIESLAREAQSRDPAREAIALSLEWPAESTVLPERPRHHAWLGWGALIAAIAVAVAAAVVAVLWSPPEATTPSPTLPIERGLKMDQHLSHPRAAASRRPGALQSSNG